MTAGIDGLAWLLSPLSVEAFIAESWEQKPQVVARDDPEYFKTLFRAADFELVLEFGQLRPPAIRVVSNGEGPTPDEYLQSDGRLDLNQLRKLYVEGHTIVVNGLQKYWGPVAEFAESLQRRLCFNVLVNAYLTPANSQGLRPHYDSHNVLIVQLSGIKAWRLYRCEVACPLYGTARREPFSRDELAEPLVVTMSAGDVMYIPRGWVHEADTGESSSLHLTIGIFPPLWLDLAAKALSSLAVKNERLRHALPVGFLDDADIMQTLERGLKDLARLLEKEGSATDALSMLEDDFVRASRTSPDGQFVAALDRLSSIDLETRLILRPHLYSRVVPVDSGVAIQYARTLVQGPANYKDAMTFVVRSQAPFAVSDLPGLDDQRQISLAKRLVRDGLLTFADADAPGSKGG